jgi:hypothetical protein
MSLFLVKCTESLLARIRDKFCNPLFISPMQFIIDITVSKILSTYLYLNFHNSIQFSLALEYFNKFVKLNFFLILGIEQNEEKIIFKTKKGEEGSIEEDSIGLGLLKHETLLRFGCPSAWSFYTLIELFFLPEL